jgi:hypothetical protein
LLLKQNFWPVTARASRLKFVIISNSKIIFVEYFTNRALPHRSGPNAHCYRQAAPARVFLADPKGESERFGQGMPRRPAHVTQADIARAIRAAEQSGSPRTVEIAPDGTIKLVPIEQTRQVVAKKREIIL